jgi:putative transposase
LRNPFRDFNGSPEVIRLAVIIHTRYPLPPRQGEYLLFERGIGICHATARFSLPLEKYSETFRYLVEIS